MTPNLEEFNYWLITFSVNVSCIPLILVAWIYLFVSTPTNQRWTTPFNLAFSLFATAAFLFINLTVMQYYLSPMTADISKRRIGLAFAAVTMNLHAFVAELSLAWMAYRIYPWSKFKILLPAIVVFIAGRVGTQIWASVLMISRKDARVAGSTMAILLMWNLIFFSSLFIYRYWRKLKNAFKTSRFYKTVLEISIQNAILPTIFVIPAVITNFFTSDPTMFLITGLLTVLFRLVLTVVVANSLHSLNLRKNSARPKRRADPAQANTPRLTSLHLASSFGLEHKAEKVLQSFLLELHSSLGGEMGYFIEKNRYGQMNIISGFSFDNSKDALTNVTIFSAHDLTERRKIPFAALEYGLEQTYPVVYDLELEDEESNDFRSCLSDRNDVDSVLILPITTPESGKQKIIYLENVETGLSIDSRMLDLLSQQLAASLESSILFKQLENINRSLEDEVNKRTAELELRTLQLEQAKEDALEAANAKSIFLSNMSHEIRTPISQVILASELLTNTISSAEGKEYANIITNSGRLLLNLVNDILDFSKLESGKVVLEEVSFNLHGLIQITMDAFNTEKDCRLGHYISDDTPSYVIGDETRLRQILTNLVSNAIKFTNSGYVMLFVTSQLIANDAYDIQFRVVDTGCGIAADRVNKIFGRFEQEDESITRKFGGTGLGFGICQNLCHLMGSHLSVHSQIDHGSTFSFTVRFQKAVAPVACSPFSQILKGQPRVLLLEGTPPLFESRSGFAYQLETMGCITECCDIQTCHPLATASYELVVVDLIDCNCAENGVDISLILHVLNESKSPVLFTHSATQDLSVTEILTAIGVQSQSSNGRIQTLRHPFKQSSLFKVISGLLTQIAMTDIHINSVEDPQKQVPIAAAHVLPIADHLGEDSIEKLPLEDYKINILLAEDNLINQKIVRTMITQLGYAVDIADDGLFAVKMAREKFYDLILMDVRMPNMDGLEATRQIRSQQGDMNCADREKQPRTSYIVGLSADVLTSNVNFGLEAGMDLYMSKPASKSKLSEVIEEVLKRKQD